MFFQSVNFIKNAEVLAKINPKILKYAEFLGRKADIITCILNKKSNMQNFTKLRKKQGQKC